MAVLIVMSAIIMIVVFAVTKESMSREAILRYEGVVQHANEKIRGVLSDVYIAAVNNINDIERDINDPDKLQAHLEQMVRINPYMSSCRLIFEPDFYPQLGHNYEIYAWRDSSGVIKGKQMNEKHPDYLVHAWYKDAFKCDGGVWTPPYFDRASSMKLTTTYLAHFHDSKGRKVGMLGADVSLQWLSERQKRIDNEVHERFEKEFKQKSYCFIIDNDGTYLVHPDESRVLKSKFQNITARNGEKIGEEMARKMLDDEGGYAEINNDGTQSLMFYSHVKYADWTIIKIVPEAIINHNGNMLAAIILAVFFVGLIIIYFLCHRFLVTNLRPLKRFVTATNKVAQGDFDVELPEVKSLEIDALRTAFYDMQKSLTQKISELKETTDSKEAVEQELKDTTDTKERLEQELKVASDLQMQMLPKTYPPFPERTDIDIFGEVVTAKEVGGDLFDFFIRDEMLFFSIGDAAGKGVPAALVMAITRSMFRAASMVYTSPKQIVESINRTVCQSNDSYLFVTLFMGVIDLATGKLRYSNAGHEPPMLVGSHTRLLGVDNNIPLGLRTDWQYSEQETILMPGTTLFLYTDGFTEAETADQRRYGRDRMSQNAIRLAAKRFDARTFVKEIRKTERAFVNYIPQNDDISLLAIKYRGNIDSKLYYRSVLLNNNVDEVPVLANFIDGICNDMNFTDLDRTGVHLAVEEAVVNAMQYAYPKGSTGHIYVEATAHEENVYFEVRDNGAAFDPTKVPKVDVNERVKQHAIGGLGIHLIRHYMDNVFYERLEDKNVLTMIKKINKK